MSFQPHMRKFGEIDYKNRRNSQNCGNGVSADFYDTLLKVNTDNRYNFGKVRFSILLAMWNQGLREYFCLAGAWSELKRCKIGQLSAARCSRFSKQTNLTLYFSNFYLCSYQFYVTFFAQLA